MGHIKIIESGDTLEIYRYERELPKRRHTYKKRDPRPVRRYRSRRLDNVGRLKKGFARLVRVNLARDSDVTLLTLTMARRVRLSTAYGYFTGFAHCLRKKLGKDFQYIAVPEFQKKGRVHFHCIVWGLSDELILNEGSTGKGIKGKRRFAEWLDKKGYGIERLGNTRFLQRIWGYGFCDLTPTDGSSKLASYLSKYMSKAVFDKRILSQKAYVSSRGIVRPMQTSLHEVGGYAKELWGVDESNLTYSRDFDSMWLGRCNYQVYNLKDI